MAILFHIVIASVAKQSGPEDASSDRDFFVADGSSQ
jgi:hypothetical protein